MILVIFRINEVIIWRTKIGEKIYEVRNREKSYSRRFS